MVGMVRKPPEDKLMQERSLHWLGDARLVAPIADASMRGPFAMSEDKEVSQA
jgi:hypothetical protein